jgi:site-specific recombinase XerD
VRGKGNRERSIPINNGAYDALEDWLHVRGPALGPLFWPARKGGKFNNRRMAAQSIYHILKQRAAEAKVSDFSPHDMRRAFITDLLEGGADMLIVSQLAGHASPATTARYDLRGGAEKRKAVSLLRFPYRRRVR